MQAENSPINQLNIRLNTQLKNPPTVLILASGRGERFLASGGTTHKLQALLAGKTVLQHTLDAVKASGLPWHLEDAGHPGMGDSIAAAVSKTPDASGWLILPADLPLIQPATLLQVAEALQTNDVVLPCFAKEGANTELDQALAQRGHPVGFGAVCQQDLLNLSGNKGAAIVIIAYTAIKLIVKDIGIVTDIDTVDDLARAEVLAVRLLKNRSFTINAGI
jgi:molybdenum cofactor cytidylyltransferase